MTDRSSYSVFAERMLHNDSKWIPEILKSMITEEQANLLISLPGTAAEMSVKFGKDIEEIENDLHDMFRKGLTFKKTREGVTKWNPPLHIAQFHDATIVWPEATEKFYELWRTYMEEEWPQVAPVFTQFLPRPFTRVIPVNQSLEMEKSQILAPDNVREMIEKADRLAITKCTCRTTMKKCNAPIDACLQVNRGADYSIERGTGREVSREEALEIMKQSQEGGLVHVTINKAGIGHFICNCCGCCCQSFTLLISDGVELCDPSRFRPHVKEDLCTACGECQDRCWFNAIELSDNGITIIEEKCMGCGQCAVGCAEEAVVMTEVREPGFIPS